MAELCMHNSNAGHTNTQCCFHHRLPHLKDFTVMKVAGNITPPKTSLGSPWMPMEETHVMSSGSAQKEQKPSVIHGEGDKTIENRNGAEHAQKRKTEALHYDDARDEMSVSGTTP